MVVRRGLAENRVRIVAVDAAQLDLFAVDIENFPDDLDFLDGNVLINDLIAAC